MKLIYLLLILSFICFIRAESWENEDEFSVCDDFISNCNDGEGCFLDEDGNPYCAEINAIDEFSEEGDLVNFAPNDDPCKNNHCPEGTLCANIRGSAHCLTLEEILATTTQSSDPCKNKKCPGREICANFDGHAKCVDPSTVTGFITTTGGLPPIDDTECGGRKCILGFKCLLINSVPTCVARDADPLCGGRLCNPGQTCANIKGKPRCVDGAILTLSPTSGHHSSGHHSSGHHSSGFPTSSSGFPTSSSGFPTSGQPDRCSGYQCPAGFFCRSLNNVATCIPKECHNNTCEGFQCKDGFKCIEVNHAPTCIQENPPNNHCLGRDCQKHEICCHPFQEWNPRCLEKCTFMNCPPHMQCVHDNWGNPECRDLIITIRPL